MRDLNHRLIPDFHVNIGTVGSGLPIRISLRRRAGHLVVATIVLIWAAMATPMVPLMAVECGHAKQKPVCHDTQSSPENNHACCPKKAKSESTPPPMPGCPMHEGLPPSSCMDSTLSCCALEERESITRRTVKPEKKSTDETVAAQVVVANASHSLSPRPGLEWQLRDGLRYEKPVLESKTDFRI